MNKASTSNIDQAQLELGELLARARVLQEITQQDLGRLAGVSERAIQRMEAGANTTLSTWLSAAQQLGYLNDILSILKQNKPKTIEQSQAIADRKFQRRIRVRN